MDDSKHPRVLIGRLADICRAAGASEETGAPQARRLVHHLVDLNDFGHQLGLTLLEEVSPGIAELFIRSRRPNGAEPSSRLMQQRRTALRFGYRLARAEGLTRWDPSSDIGLPPRSPLGVRPLRDEEVELCRSHAMWTLTDTRHGAAWALAEATCRTSEIPHITVDDVDLATGRVWIHGGKTTSPRWGQLTEWGQEQVRRRMKMLAGHQDQRLVYSGRSTDAGQVSACAAVVDVLRRAGLADQPDVRPGSVAAWAGQQILAETGRIDVVAQRLGMTRLDRVAAFIGWDWQDQQAEP